MDQATKDLIEKEAKDYSDGYLHHSYGMKTGYIAGATVWAEKLRQLETQSHDQVRIIEHLEEKLKWERNKVIDDVIDLLNGLRKNGTFRLKEIYEGLESLKTP